MANGYNAAIITDHNTFRGAIDAQEIARTHYNDSFKVIMGTEWTTERIHMNLIGNSDRFVDELYRGDFADVPEHPSDEQIRAIINRTHDYGGIVVVAHYPRSQRKYGTALPSRSELLDWGVDYIEVVNRGTYDSISRDFCLEHGLGMITGTDLHDPVEDGTHGWTVLEPAEFTEDAIFTALKARDTEILYNETGVPYTAEHRTNPLYTVMEPFTIMGEASVTSFTWSEDEGLTVESFVGLLYSLFACVDFLTILNRFPWRRLLLLKSPGLTC
jgi:hypothetical protein